MNPEFSQQQTQSQRQELHLSHQQLQALNLLHLPAVELQQAVDEEIASNPVLDSDPPDDAPLPTLSDDPDEWLEQLLALPDEQRFIRGTVAPVSESEQARRERFLESVTEEISLPQHLLNQINYQGFPEPLKSACIAIIDALDEDGFFKSTPADLAMSTQLPMPLLEEALQRVREFDPTGIAAFNVRDRLLMQLERKGEKDGLVYTAVRDHLEEIGKNHLPQVARELGIGIETMNAVVDEIRGLNPRLEFHGEVAPNEYIREEAVITENADGSFDIKVLNDALPPLYISRTYLKLLKDPNTDKETRDFIKKRLESATGLINGLLRRQSTIKRVVTAIVECQSAFFHEGESHLKPLTQERIAEMCDINASTVSRTIDGKFLRCKFGLYPLSHFFSSGIPLHHTDISDNNNSAKNVSAPNTENVSSEVIKNRIRALISAENPYKPLSDAKLTSTLVSEGFTLARRTVAKYREQVGIPPTHLRRKF